MKQDIQNGMKLEYKLEININVNQMQVFVMIKNVEKIVEECCENIDESEVICATPNSYENVCGSCTVYIISHIFHNMYKHQQCYFFFAVYLFLLALKEE